MQQLPVDYGRGGCAVNEVSIFDCDRTAEGVCGVWCYVEESCAAPDVTASTIIPGNFYSYLNCGNEVVIPDAVVDEPVVPVDDTTTDGGIITGTITTPAGGDVVGDDVAGDDVAGDDVAGDD